MITEEQTIWFPGIYDGRSEPEWAQPMSEILVDVLVKRVQRRAREDGEWAIANGFVGDNEDKMRRMMAWVASEKNIRQAVEYLHRIKEADIRSVDWVCRDLANGSKWAIK